MSDQTINMTMHTLNKYGIPCTDVTDYVTAPSAPSLSEGSSAVFYLQKYSSQTYSYLVKTKLKSTIPDIPIPDPFEPITGITGYAYCVFYNEGSSGFLDYYSLGSGSKIKTVALPFPVANSFPAAVDINSEFVAYDPVHSEGEPPCYGRFRRNADGGLSEIGKVHLQTPLQWDSVTYGGQTISGESTYTGYLNNRLINDTVSLRPSFNYNNKIHSNCFGEDQQTGRFYEEEFPDLSNDLTYPEWTTKRKALRYDNLFVGSLSPESDYVIQVPFYTISDDGDPRGTFMVDVFNDQKDVGGVIGTGQIQGYYYNNLLYILISSDDPRGGAGNQMYQKWFNSAGVFLYDWVWPTDENGNMYGLTGRINHQNSFFYVAVNLTTKNSYLLHYSLSSGSMIKTELINPYRDIPLEGFYQISNFQLIADKYLMVRTSSGHIIFFDAYNPSQGIKGEVVIESNWAQLGTSGYYVVPQLGDDQPTSDPTTNVLLQLCNAIRTLKMTWATNQVQVCQAHANWCVENAVFQHEGPGGNSVGDRNQAVGIYAGVSENITIVNVSIDDTEQTDAFNNWIESPHHLEGIIRGGNKYMSFACATYPESVTQISVGIGMWNGTEYTTEPGIREVQEWERGKLKIYVQNFIWY